MKSPKHRIEPRKSFDKAIVGKTKDGTLIYSYYKLVRLVSSEQNWPRIMAVDWIEYNIIPIGGFKVTYNRKYNI